MSKPGIDQLLITTALQPELRRRVLQTPDEVFEEFDLTEDEKDVLRHPDHRLLALFGTALARQKESAEPRHEEASEEATPVLASPAAATQEMSLVLTVVPYAQLENGDLKGFAYATWVNALSEGTDPATLPQPPGATIPGEARTPLHAVIELSAMQLRDASGNAQVGMWASLRQSSNVTAPPLPESAGKPHLSPFGSDIGREDVQAAIAAVRSASSEIRYDRLIDLLRTLRRGDGR